MRLINQHIFIFLILFLTHVIHALDQFNSFTLINKNNEQVKIYLPKTINKYDLSKLLDLYLVSVAYWSIYDFKGLESLDEVTKELFAEKYQTLRKIGPPFEEWYNFFETKNNSINFRFYMKTIEDFFYYIPILNVEQNYTLYNLEDLYSSKLLNCIKRDKLDRPYLESNPRDKGCRRNDEEMRKVAIELLSFFHYLLLQLEKDINLYSSKRKNIIQPICNQGEVLKHSLHRSKKEHKLKPLKYGYDKMSEKDVAVSCFLYFQQEHLKGIKELKKFEDKYKTNR